jgi:hypothetical protein
MLRIRLVLDPPAWRLTPSVFDPNIDPQHIFTFGIWSCGGPRSLSLSVDLGRCNVHTVDGFQLASCDVRVTLPTGAGSVATFAKSKPRTLA